MTEFLKKNLIIIILFLITLFTGFFTFLTFIDKSFIQLNPTNLQYLLIGNILLIFLLFVFVFLEIKQSIKTDIDRDGINSNKKYITYFSLFTLIPSILISIFSLFLFSFALEKYFDKKVTTVVNNSYELAKNYVTEVQDKVKSEIILIAFDINKSAKFLNDDENAYSRFLNTQKIIRKIDEIHIIDINKKLLFTNINDKSKYIPPMDRALELILEDDRPLKILNAEDNISAAIMRLQVFNERFLYVVKYLDPKISNYLNESQEAINFYYNIEEKSTGIKISFAIIYLIVVTLLLFISITIAIRFSSRFFRSINNLIYASNAIGDGDLSAKVPELKTDKDLETLNKNFNSMIIKLKNQQEKLIINERHEAWESLARKLAHEIKNPLTPIQLSIDSLQEKFYKKIPEGKEDFKKYLETINRQINDIEKLVNEFSSFARMPRPVFKKIDLEKTLNRAIDFYKMSSLNSINFKNNSDRKLMMMGDEDQLYRVFINLIKNSEEAILDKKKKNQQFKGIIDVVIESNNDYIAIKLKDNGIGKIDISKIMTPYFTTKKDGTGLGLPIVSKIINEHSGEFSISNLNEGVLISINLPFIK